MGRVFVYRFSWLLFFLLVELVFPVALSWVDAVLAEDLSDLFVGDGDVLFVDEEDDGLTTVFSADSEVVHFARSSEWDFPGVVDSVVADSPGLVGDVCLPGFVGLCCFEADQ